MKSFKQYIQEAGSPPILPTPTPGDSYVADTDNVNIGKIAGLAVGDAANPLAVIQNPNVVYAFLKDKGVIDKVPYDVDSEIVSYKPHYSNNLGAMMGLGLDDKKFQELKDLVSDDNDEGSDDSDDDEIERFAETDDPEQSDYLSWQELNKAVSNYFFQNTKNLLKNNYLFNGGSKDQYQQSLSPEYDLNSKNKTNASKIIQQTALNIMGKDIK